MALAWHWHLLAFLVAWCGIWFVAWVCVTVVGLVRSSFLCPRVSGLLLQFIHVPLHVVVVFTVRSLRGILISFRVSLVFAPILLTLCYYYLIYYYWISMFIVYFVIYYYCYYCYYYYYYFYCLLLLLFLLFPLSSWLCVTGAYPGAGYEEFIKKGWHFKLLYRAWVGCNFILNTVFINLDILCIQ